MAKQLALEGVIVKKHNDLIRSKINITNTNACRILASLIACINTNDKTFKQEYSIDLKHVLPDDAGGKSYTAIKNACKELAEATAELENVQRKELELYPFFMSVKYKKGFVTAEFNANLKGLLIGLKKHFTQYNILEYVLLPSNYSQRIFEIIKSWEDKPEFTISLERLHYLLDTPPSMRSDFRNFRVRVLEKAHADIHEFTSLKYEWEAIKKGRSYEEVRFVLSTPRKAELQQKEDRKEKADTAKNRNKIMLQAMTCYEQEKNPTVCTKANNSRTCQVCQALNF